MENQFSEAEMKKLRMDYLLGKPLICPRCEGTLESFIEEGGILPMQVPGQPTIDYLGMECVQEGIQGRIMYGEA